MFVPNLMKFPEGILEILIHENEVDKDTVTLTSDYHLLQCSALLGNLGALTLMWLSPDTRPPPKHQCRA